VSIDFARLPTRTLKPGTTLHRIHRQPPWYFDASPTGRFNPAGQPRRGACYWAERPLGAFVEAFRTAMALTEADVAARSLSTIVLEHELVVANLTVKRALAAELTTAADYTAPQQLACDLQGTLEGIRYRMRHDLSQQLIAVAWFGPAGRPGRAGLARLPSPRPSRSPTRSSMRPGGCSALRCCRARDPSQRQRPWDGPATHDPLAAHRERDGVRKPTSCAACIGDAHQSRCHFRRLP